MNKIITFIIAAMIVFSWLVTHNTAKPEKDLSADVPFIIKSNRPGTCRVSTISVDTKRGLADLARKLQL
ncbi:hypothetical protein [Enterobacter hormaechei]|uniref:hypothetical protein n=1 Tax=Enterobacter hormaechei TaxID=158836 RepID=UPI0005F8B263|nr:hypothetical protein [Enterobacter hormaechei]KJX32528.1 hypothetical protein SG76_09905 [Enterobacter hormaechei subsp. steigerwaltii]MDL4634463.1 hypothetical protein [Enterobacter hormaechei]HBL5402544.1 hypothetical protein [Enterobacter hormaechei]HCD8308392.1 hypothetical protein [Enterobacter hormaechei]